MISSESVNIIADVGIENDRYAKTVGSYSCVKASIYLATRPKGARPTIFIVISADELDAAVQRSGIPLSDYGGLRRNIVVRGMAQKPLIGAIGSAVQLGETVIIICCH
jgi:MOSC domain-containing protein YiiM